MMLDENDLEDEEDEDEDEGGIELGDEGMHENEGNEDEIDED